MEATQSRDSGNGNHFSVSVGLEGVEGLSRAMVAEPQISPTIGKCTENIIMEGYIANHEPSECR